MWDMRRQRRFMNRANQQIGKVGELLEQQYGFLADPSLPVWENVKRRIGEMNCVDLFGASRISNMACHNLLKYSSLPPGTTRLLGLGLNYCIKPPSTTSTTDHTYERMIKDLRRMYAFRKDAPSNDGYIQKLYIKSDYEFEPASDEIEQAVSNFCNAVKAEQLQRSRRIKPTRNLTLRQWKLIQFFKDNDRYIVIQGDKNLGPCILDREDYIHRGCKEHLGNVTNYRQLSQIEAENCQNGLKYRFDAWISKYRPRDPLEPPAPHKTISEPEHTFLIRSRSKNPNKLARFRQTAKVHKKPLKTRPIVCCAGTFMNDWSKWLDFWLQKLKSTVPTYVKDSQQVLDEIKTLTLPPNAKLFTCDANAMYNNIDTEHAIEVISWWLNDLKTRGQLPHDFPLEAVIEAMKIIMRNNIFEYGDCFFLQLLGTAMGTSAAVMWATIYYAYHEVHTLIPRYGNFLLYFKRFIDDCFGIWVGNFTNNWSDFCNDVNDFGVLTWDILDQRPSDSVDFLDLTISIHGNKLITKTYQKKMNLYLYIPPASAHPTGCIKGTIFGLVRRYHAQNTYRQDYINYVRLLYRRLKQRGWDKAYIRPLIIEACNVAERTSQAPTTPATLSQANDEENRLFIHLVFHPDDIPRKRIQELYQIHCGDLLRDELEISRPTIAYSRPKNIGDFITKAKLHQAPGRPSSTIMGEYKAGLAPP